MLEGKLICAHPVDDATREMVQARFTRYFGQDVRLAVELDRALLAGFVVTVNHLRFDYSVRNRLGEMRKFLLSQE